MTQLEPSTGSVDGFHSQQACIEYHLSGAEHHLSGGTIPAVMMLSQQLLVFQDTLQAERIMTL